MLGARGLPQTAPQGSPRQEDVTEAQEGKTTPQRPLGATLCAAGFGSAPVLTSSSSGTQMYGLSGGDLQSERTKHPSREFEQEEFQLEMK
ncbi:unnamed protein product [Pleuronectes platessa]|uniref:Uncharacterized protein n=1 Tax=Pleuronectes platessa TaxID=8262 RepID=A0A9N7Y6R0_PLEPL|nr:unnamed protein product [Pleuronectes platessa]